MPNEQGEIPPIRSAGRGWGNASDEAWHHAQNLLRATRDELDRAESKAAIMLAGCGVGAGAVVNIVLGGAYQSGGTLHGLHWLWWLALAGVVLGLGFLGRAIYPRTERRGGPSVLLTYYGDVVATPRSSVQTRLARNRQDALAVTVDQLCHVAGIAAVKYRSIRVALWFFAIGLVASLAAAFTSSFG